MSLPQVRRVLKGFTTSNQSLQDILKSCMNAVDIVSVEPYNGKRHNTKIVLQIDKGASLPDQERYVERAHLYNRIEITELLMGVGIQATDTNDAIAQLSLLGFDFTADDIVYANGSIQVLDNSLGYYKKAVVGCEPTSFSFIPANHGGALVAGKQYVLSYLTTINGVTSHHRIIINPDGPQTVGELALELFLYSGIDLMRQHGMRNYFAYTPIVTNGTYLDTDPITLTGLTVPTQPDPDWNYTAGSVDLQFVPMGSFDLRNFGEQPDDVFTNPSAYVDYVMVGMGGPASVHSCAIRANSHM